MALSWFWFSTNDVPETCIKDGLDGECKVLPTPLSNEEMVEDWKYSSPLILILILHSTLLAGYAGKKDQHPYQRCWEYAGEGENNVPRIVDMTIGKGA